jgi:hypothetical protein
MSAGLYISVLERPDDIVEKLEVPEIMAEGCRAWWNYTDDNVVHQIDSGL